jgi:hypothetical protein
VWRCERSIRWDAVAGRRRRILAAPAWQQTLERYRRVMRLPPPSRSLLSPKVLGALYRKHLSDCREERLFLGNVGFLSAFVTVRAITHSIRAGRGPFRNVTPGGRHIHHMTFGILGLLVTGYAWNAQLGIGSDPARRWGSRVSATGYGMASALTLDEFALWLNLQDDYWTKQGRESIDAVVIFGSLLFLALMNKDLVREASQIASGRRDARVLLAHDAASREPSA